MKDRNHEPLSPEDPVFSTLFFDKVLNRLKIDLNSPESQLSVQWENIVGTQIASICRFVSLKKGVLTLCCDHPAKTSSIRINRNEIIKSIRGVFPELEIIKVNVTTVYKS